MTLETWEMLSYVVTVIGLPAAILAFLYEKKKEREAAEDEVHQLLSDNYQEFMRVVLEHPDLHLFSQQRTPALTEEQVERMTIIFGMAGAMFFHAPAALFGVFAGFKTLFDLGGAFPHRELGLAPPPVRFDDLQHRPDVVLDGEPAEDRCFLRQVGKPLTRPIVHR